jgi:hypothetical protein
MLSPDEQILFERLSAFAGGFDLPAAEALAGGPPLQGRVEPLLVSLVDKSLVNASRRTGSRRFRQLETLRQFGDERLRVRGEVSDVRRRHLDYFVAWAEAADARLKTAEEPRWHRAFEIEWPNLRQAFGYACELNDGDAAYRLVWKTLWWANIRAWLEVGDWCDAALELEAGQDHTLRPIIAAGGSFYAWLRNDLERADRLISVARAEEARLGPAPEPFVPSLAVFLEVASNFPDALRDASAVQQRALGSGDKFWELIGACQRAAILAELVWSGLLSVEETELHQAELRHAARVAEDFGYPSAIMYTSMALGAAVARTNPDDALRLLERAIAMATTLDVEFGANHVRRYLGLLYSRLRRPHDALALWGSTIERHRRSGEWAWVWMGAVTNISALIQVGEPQLAALILGAVRQTRDAATIEVSEGLSALESDVRQRLGQQVTDRLLTEGKDLAIDDIARRVLDAIARTLTDSPRVYEAAPSTV